MYIAIRYGKYSLYLLYVLRNRVALLFIAIRILLCILNIDTFTGTAHSILAVFITLLNIFPRCRKKVKYLKPECASKFF